MPRLPALAALAALVAVATPRPAAGQWLPADRFADATAAAHADPAAAGASFAVPSRAHPQLADTVDLAEPTRPALMAAGSAIGAGFGAVGGAFGGVALYEAFGPQGSGEDPGLGSFLAGYFLGAGAGAALGAHLTNQGRGELGATLLASTVVGATGFVFVRGGGDMATVAAVGIPIASIVTAVLFERSTTGSRGEPPPVGPGAGDAG